MEYLFSPAVWICLFFTIGYLLIVFEHTVNISKTTTALLMGVSCWAVQFADPSLTHLEHQKILTEHLGKASEIILFLLGALAIVELISTHNGFWLITRGISATSKLALLWIIGFVSFLISAVLDNLTTTVVMVTLLRKILPPGEDRAMMGGAVVIAANAGGAWTPIGDVTTTMLWIGGQITVTGVMVALLIPSLVCLLVSLACFSYQLGSGRIAQNFPVPGDQPSSQMEPYGTLILAVGVGCLIFVPIFKMLTGLPPLMGMLLGLAILWVITDLVHHPYDERKNLRVPAVLSRVDLAAVLFFLGILLAIDALEEAGLLQGFAAWVDATVPSHAWTPIIIGLASAVVDNVPLVAAAMKMYDLHTILPGSPFWHQIAYAAGTGGSILIIGSAAGVAFMGLEQVGFFWWVRRVALAALLGFLAGYGSYLLLIPLTG